MSANDGAPGTDLLVPEGSELASDAASKVAPVRDGAPPRPLRGVLSAAEIASLRERNDRLLRVLVIGYLSLLVVLGLLFGVRLTPDTLVVGVVLIGATVLPRRLGSHRVVAILEWTPFLVLAMAYELIRGFGPAVIARANLDDIPAVEKILFGGQIATELLQSALRPLSGFDPLAAGATIVYMLHTPLPLVVAAYLWWRGRRLFYDFLAALAVLSIAAFATYLLFPAAPPWWAAATGHLAGPSGLPMIAYLKPGALDSLVTSAGIDGHALFALTFGDISPDPVAAFPSLHAAYPLLAYVFLRRLGGPAAWVMLAFTGAAWFSIVYLGDHYVVDILGGIVYVAVVVVATPHLDRLWHLGRVSDGASVRATRA